jgi:hypothetical protein
MKRNLCFILAIVIWCCVVSDAGQGPGGPMGPGGPVGPSGPGGPDRDRDRPRHPVMIMPPHRQIVIVTPPRPVVIKPSPVFVDVPPVVGESNSVVVWVTNSNGSRSKVILIKEGPGFVGPNGEHYSSMPMEDQLRVLYGLGPKEKVRTVITVWLTIPNGAKIPVTLISQGGIFIGPAGEYYTAMPSESQLLTIYGLGSKSVKQNTVTVLVPTSAGKKVPIVLIKDGTEYVGPRNERYAKLPSEKQLVLLYGNGLESPDPDIVTVWVDMDKGMQIPITLRKEGETYIGPSGEQYSGMPSEDQLLSLYAPQAGQEVEFVIQISNDDGTQTPVKLIKKGAEFIGPKNERYDTMPSEEQLKLIYGKPTVGSKTPEAVSAGEAMTLWFRNSNGSRFAVELIRSKDGNGYIGPKGERYDAVPSEDQLRKAYGF